MYICFSEEDINEAKKLLFVSTKTTQKLVFRLKNKKQEKFKTTDPEQIQLYMAYELHKLPSICFNHVDVTKLLKDLSVLKADISEIKANYYDEINDIKGRNKQLNISNINPKSRGYVQNETVMSLQNQSYISDTEMSTDDRAGDVPARPAACTSLPRTQCTT